MNKSSAIRELLLQGLSIHDIAARINCKPSLVSVVRSKCARQLGIKEPPIHHVRMIHGPWTHERPDVLSREIRGE